MTEEKQVQAEKQEKLKKQGEAEAAQAEIKQENPKDLVKKLSNKNQDYLFRLRKELIAGGMKEDQADAEIDSLLPDIYAAQIKGQPAGTLFGVSPTIKAGQILHPVVKPTKVPNWLLGVDSALIYTAILTGMFGLMQLFTNDNKKTANGSGILTLIVMGVAMGWYFTKYNNWMKPDPKTGKTAWGKVIWGLIGSLVLIMAIVLILSLKPLAVINPVLPGWADLLVAAVATGAWYLIRKHYGIHGSSFSPDTLNKKKK